MYCQSDRINLDLHSFPTRRSSDLFQDITQQKLEYMRGSILSDVMQNLDLLSVETQEMMKKDLFLAIRVEAERMNASSGRSEEHTSELQSRLHLVCRLLLEKKNTKYFSVSSIQKQISRYVDLSVTLTS